MSTENEVPGHAPGTLIAGLPTRTQPEGLAHPISAVAMLKGLTQDGRVMYWQLRTEDVTEVEAIGMHEAASAMYKQRLPK